MSTGSSRHGNCRAAKGDHEGVLREIARKIGIAGDMAQSPRHGASMRLVDRPKPCKVALLSDRWVDRLGGRLRVLTHPI